MLCARVEPMVHGLEKEHGTAMRFVVVDHKAGDSPERIARYELGRHGMVITDAKGEKLWSEPGHEQTRERVEAAIRQVLGR